MAHLHIDSYKEYEKASSGMLWKRAGMSDKLAKVTVDTPVECMWKLYVAHSIHTYNSLSHAVTDCLAPRGTRGLVPQRIESAIHLERLII